MCIVCARLLDPILILPGYPPADHSVREYLVYVNSKIVASDRANAFLEALFNHTAETLLNIETSLDYVGFARLFRSLMTDGQNMRKHNQFREGFYRRVIEEAKMIESTKVRNVRVCHYHWLRCYAR